MRGKFLGRCCFHGANSLDTCSCHGGTSKVQRRWLKTCGIINIHIERLKVVDVTNIYSIEGKIKKNTICIQRHKMICRF